MSRPHNSQWAIKHRFIPLQSLDEKDALHPLVGLDGSPLDAELAHESPETEALTALMGQLSEEDRELLYMLYWDGKSLRQCEEGLGLPKTSVARRRDLLLHKLRRDLSAA